MFIKKLFKIEKNGFYNHLNQQKEFIRKKIIIILIIYQLVNQNQVICCTNEINSKLRVKIYDNYYKNFIDWCFNLYKYKISIFLLRIWYDLIFIYFS